MICLLQEFGVLVKTTKRDEVIINNFKTNNKTIILSPNSIKKFRDSIYILALAPLFKEIDIPNCFGGCLLGERPITAQLQVLESFGFSVKYNKNIIKIKKGKENKKSNTIFLKKSVSVTKIAILIASCKASKTILQNIAIEPNVHDLILFLKKLGIKIKFISSDSVSVKGRFKWHAPAVSHTLISDRMEAASFICAVSAVGGKIKIKNFNLNALGNAKDLFKKMGAQFTMKNNDVFVKCVGVPLPICFKTGYYPLTCTDMHPLIAVPLFLAKGRSSITETIFSDRWNYAKELSKMGAKWKLKDNTLYISGANKLTGNIVRGQDIRCTAALIIAGLAAEGETIVTGEKYLDRAYDGFVNKLISLGADVKFIKNYKNKMPN